MKLKILFLFLALSACAEQTRPQVYVYEIDDPNSLFSIKSLGILGPNELEFRNVVVGQEIVQNSAIVMPLLGEGGRLVMAFHRADLEKAFVQGFFFDRDSSELESHPFASVGIETLLTKEQLIITVHEGVIMHFRGDMKSSRSYRTFVNDEVFGRVMEVQGIVKYSDDQVIIRDKLKDVFTFAVYTGAYLRQIEGFTFKTLEDGTIIGVPPPGLELPHKKYPPRVSVE